MSSAENFIQSAKREPILNWKKKLTPPPPPPTPHTLYT